MGRRIKFRATEGNSQCEMDEERAKGVQIFTMRCMTEDGTIAKTITYVREQEDEEL